MKKLISIIIAIVLAMPQQAFALRPMAAKESFKKRDSQVAQYLCPVCKETERDRTQILYETENFIVVPDRGPLSLGHLLISPKNHALSMSMLDEAQLMELEMLHVYVRHILANAYNRDVIFFEHGSVSEDEIRVMQGGNSITHAHLHAIPVPRGFDILRKLAKRPYLSVKPIRSFHDLAAQYTAEAAYFFYENPQGEKYVIELEGSFKAPSQFLRLIIGEELGYPARGNWKLADDEIGELYQEWVQRAKTDLLFKFKKLPESKDILFVDESFPGPISEEAIEMFEKLSCKVNYQFSDESCESIDDVEDIAPLRVYYFERRDGASIDARRSSTLWPRGTTPYDWRVGSTFTTSQTYDSSQKPEVLTWHVKESSLGCNVCNIPPDEILFKTKEEMEIMPVAVNIHPVARNNILLYTKEPQGQYMTPKRIKQILYFGQKVLGNGWAGYWNAIFGAANLHFHAHFHQSGSGLRNAIHNGRASLINRRVRDGVTSAVIKGWHTSGVLFRGNDIEKITEQAWLLLENLTAKNISYNVIYYFDRDETTFVAIPRREVLVDDLKVGLQELLGQEAIGAASNTMIGAYDLDGNLFICNKELFGRIKNTPEIRRKIAMLYSRALGKAGYNQDDTMRLYDETFKRTVVPKRADGKKVFAERAKRSEGDLFLAVGDLDKMQCMNRIYGKKIFGDENKGVLGKIFEVMINTSRKYGVDLYRYLSGDEFGITSRARMAAQEFNTMLLEVRKRVKAISSQYAICMVENVSENALSILKDTPTVIEVEENEEGGANVLFRLYETESLEDALKRISEDITTALNRQVSVKRHWFNNGYLWIPTLSIGARHIKEDFERASEQADTNIFENVYASAMEEAALISKEAKKTRDTSIVVQRKDEIAGVIKKERKGESILKEEAKGAILQKIELPKQERDFYDPLTGLLRQEALEGDMISHGVGKGKTFLEITDTCYTSERFVEQKHRRIKWGPSFKGKRLGARIMAINEFYGDDAGDEAIRLIAKAVKENLPEQWAGKVRLARAPPDKIQILIDDIVDEHDVMVFLDSVQQYVNNALKDGITARIKAVMIPTDNVNDATELLSCVEPLRKIEDGISILPSPREASHPGTGNVLAVYDIQPGDTHKKAIYKKAYTRFRKEDTREAAQELRDTYGGRLQIPLHLPKTKWEGLQKMVIVIAGMHGSGKNTAAELLAQQTGLRMYNVGDLKRKMALERGFDSIKAYNAYLATNPHEQCEVDGFLDEIQKYEITKGGVIINSFFGPYVVDTLKDELRKRGIKVIKVLLTCPPQVRAQRVSRDLRMGDAAGDFKQVFSDLAERDQKDLDNLASIAGGADAANKSYDPSNYDIVRDTSQKGADQVCQDILDFASDLIEKEYIPAPVHDTVQGPELIPTTALLAIEASALRPMAGIVPNSLGLGTATIAFRLMNEFCHGRWSSYSNGEEIFLYITTKCPLNCDPCLAQDLLEEYGFFDVGKELIFRRLNQLRGFEKITLLGPGEPTAYAKTSFSSAKVSNDFIEILQYAYKCGIKEVRIFTNGWAIPEDAQEAEAFFRQFPTNVRWLLSADWSHQKALSRLQGRSDKSLRNIVKVMEELAKKGIIKTAYNMLLSEKEPYDTQKAITDYFGLTQKLVEGPENIFFDIPVQQGNAARRQIGRTMTLDEAHSYIETRPKHSIYSKQDMFFITMDGCLVSSPYVAFMTATQRNERKWRESRFIVGNLNDYPDEYDLAGALLNKKLLFFLGAGGSFGWFEDKDRIPVSGVLLAGCLYLAGFPHQADAVMSLLEKNNKAEVIADVMYILYLSIDGFDTAPFIQKWISGKEIKRDCLQRLKIATQILTVEKKDRLRFEDAIYRIGVPQWIKNPRGSPGSPYCPVYEIESLKKADIEKRQIWGVADGLTTRFQDVKIFKMPNKTFAAEKYFANYLSGQGGFIPLQLGLLHDLKTNAYYYVEKPPFSSLMAGLPELYNRWSDGWEYKRIREIGHSLGVFARHIDNAGFKVNAKDIKKAWIGDDSDHRFKWQLVDCALTRSSGIIAREAVCDIAQRTFKRHYWLGEDHRAYEIFKENFDRGYISADASRANQVPFPEPTGKASLAIAQAA